MTASAPGSLSIGELAGLAGVTAETVRYYERAGVVPQATRGGQGRYRVYREEDVHRLRFIRRARDLGFSLDEVRELMTLASSAPDQPCTDVRRISQQHLEQVDAKIAQLTALRAELVHVIGGCDGVAPLGECRILAALGGATPVSGSR